MVSAVNWDAVPTFTDQITTGANSLADGSSVLSAAIDPALKQWFDVRILLASINPSGAPYVEIHVCPSYDNGTTFADLSDATLVACVPVTTGSSAKEAYVRRLEAPPVQFKLGERNRCGVSWAGSGNKAAVGFYNDESQ